MVRSHSSASDLTIGSELRVHDEYPFAFKPAGHLRDLQDIFHLSHY